VPVYVNPEAAHIFETAPQEQRRKIEELISLKLTQTTREKRTLEAVMCDISDKAQERGLTPEILDAILMVIVAPELKADLQSIGEQRVVPKKTT
jgi:hypothetical protein